MLKENKLADKIINSCECLSRTKDKGSNDDIKFESACQFIKFGKSTPWLGWLNNLGLIGQWVTLLTMEK